MNGLIKILAKLRGARYRAKVHYYNGVYLDESSIAPIDRNLFNDKLWVESVEWYLNEDIVNCSKPNFRVEPYLREIITLIIAECLSKSRPKILDFGGGMGNTYVPIAAKIPKKLQYEYHI